MNMMDSAKKLQKMAEKNKEKIASSVNKATDMIDKKTGNKYTDKLKKVDDAAAKFAGTAAEKQAADNTSDVADADADADEQVEPTTDDAPASPAASTTFIEPS